MTPFQTFIAHMVTMVGVIAAAVVLAADHIISGNEALLLITAVSGVTLGAVVTNGGAVSANTSASNATSNASAAVPTPLPVAVVSTPTQPDGRLAVPPGPSVG